MDTPNKQNYVNQIKEFVLKYKVAVIAAVAVLIATIVGLNIYSAQPKSVLGDIEVSFSGYNGYGVLEYNHEDIQKEIAAIAYQKAGFDKEQIDGLLNEDSIIMADIYNDSELTTKMNKAAAIMETVSFKFDKTSELSNGDTIVLSVKTSSKKSPIKSETKKYKVEGLDKVETITAKQFLKDYPVEFQGFNGYGKAILPVDKDDMSILSLATTERDGSYKNGDKVKFVVSTAYIESLEADGKKLEADEIELTVSGLKEISEVGNVTEALAKNETYIKAEHENTSNTTYTLEKQKSYIAYKTDYWGDDGSGQIYLITVYKISTVTTGIFAENKVQYAYYGYRYYITSDNKLDLETANEVSGYKTQDLANLTADLETEGYKEYTPKAE